MRNETEFIKCSKKRYLTAKAQKFTDKSIRIAAENMLLNRLSPEFKETKLKLQKIMLHLFVDKKLSIEEIKQLIKNRKMLIEN